MKQGLYIIILSVLVISLMLSSCGRIKEVSDRDRVAADNFYKLAVNYYMDGNVIQSLKSLADAEEFNPSDPKIKNMYGLIFLGKKMLQEASDNFTKAIEIDENFSDAYLNLSSVYMETGKWQEAIAILQYPSNDLLYPRKDLVYDNLGWAYHKLGQNDKAIEFLIAATTENPKQCHAWFNMGRVYKSDSRFVEAMKALEVIFQTEGCKKFFLAHYEMGIVAFRVKDYTRAKIALKNCVRFGGVSPEAIECGNYLKMIPVN